ncbi:MAG TPA: kelch repeat-containing protein, partial [Candidatus Dormibacteraeota bacterium]
AATRRRVAGRGLLALAAALAVAVAGTGVAVWRLPRSQSPGATTAVPARALSVPPGGALASAVLPMPRQPPSVVYDAAHDQALLFGGLGQTGSTWLWAHGAWTAPQPHGAPPDRSGAAAAYDPLAQRVLVFGGRQSDGTTPGDTWAWDGRSWSRLIGTGVGPAGAAGAGMAYDEADRVMVLVTAGADPVASAQTWTLAGARWVAQSAGELPVGPSPTMAFDPQTRTVLLVTAGSVPGGAARTWSWDGAVGRWRELHPASEPPGAGTGFLTPDPLSGRLLLVTPSSSRAVLALQTWAWDGRTWSRLQPATNPRFAVGLVTDRRDGVVVCFGFSRPGVPGTVDAAWAWTGKTWVELAAAPIPRFTETIASPPPRVQAWLAYNPADDRLVLLGGMGESGEQLHDTWLWDGSSWAEASGAGGPPAGGPMAFDPVSRAVILVTDAVGLRALPRPQTWSWNGVTWRRLAPAREIPSALAVIALEQDPAAGQVVAIALCCVGPDGRPGPGPRLQTWTWDGATWTPAHPSTELSGGGQMEMAYDATTRRLIAVVGGGSGRLTATWAWDGSTWTQLHPTPPSVDESSTITMAADPSTGSIVILKAVPPASVAVSRQQPMAIWTGATWTAISSPEPSPQVDTTTHATQPFFEPHLGRLIVLGSPEHDFSRAWMWTGRSWLELDAPHL